MDRPNVLMVIIDAARRDYFGCYGFPLNVTAHIDTLARRGILFENVISTAPWTVPSHGSIFTGLYPHQHGATWSTLRLNKGTLTIFDIFAEGGYEAVAVSANSLILSPYNMFGNRTKILNKVACNQPDSSSFAGDFNYRESCSERIADYFIEYLKNKLQAPPFIAYINFYDLHAKYQCRQPFRSQYIDAKKEKVLEGIKDLYALHFQEMNGELEITDEIIDALRAFYSAKLAMIDADLGRILEELRRCGFLDNCIVIVTSDHGDILGDQRRPSFHHQFSIHNSLLNVPLIFYGKLVGGPKRIDTPLIQNIDILPTLLQLCNIGRPTPLNNSPGISLAKYIFNDAEALPREYAISLYECPARFILRNKRKVNPLYLRGLAAIQDREYKLTLSDKGDIKLYHLNLDREEKKDIAPCYPDKVRQLREAFDEIKRRYPGPPGGLRANCTLAKEDGIIERLKSLGYIG
jgi:arylsulfatase A-like enzyme